MAEVTPMHGKPPVVTMTCLVIKSEVTLSLYSNPVVDNSRQKLHYAIIT